MTAAHLCHGVRLSFLKHGPAKNVGAFWCVDGGRKGKVFSNPVGLKAETQGAALLLSSPIAALENCSKQGSLNFFPTKCITLLLFHYSFGYQPFLYLCSCMIFLTSVKWVRSVILWKRQPLFLRTRIKECHIKVLGVVFFFFFSFFKSQSH